MRREEADLAEREEEGRLETRGEWMLVEDASGEGVVGREHCRPGDGTGDWRPVGRGIAVGMEELD